MKKTHIIVIPGNPGIVEYYDNFCVRKDDVEIVSKKLIEELIIKC